jgi:hypothetical protein
VKCIHEDWGAVCGEPADVTVGRGHARLPACWDHAAEMARMLVRDGAEAVTLRVVPAADRAHGGDIERWGRLSEKAREARRKGR